MVRACKGPCQIVFINAWVRFHIVYANAAVCGHGVLNLFPDDFRRTQGLKKMELLS